MSDEMNNQQEIPQQKKSFLSSTKAKVLLSVLVIIFTIVAIKGIAVANHFHKFADGPHAFMIEKISEKLNLSADQKAQVERISSEIKEKMKPTREPRENLEDEFADEFKKDNMDRNKLKELAEKREMNMKEKKDFMMDKIIEFHDLLTPEQRIKAVDSMKEMKEKFHDGKKMFEDKQN